MRRPTRWGFPSTQAGATKVRTGDGCPHPIEPSARLPAAGSAGEGHQGVGHVVDAAMGALNVACLATFGRTVTYRPGSGAPVTIAGIVDSGSRLEGNSPGTYAILFLRLADLPQPPECGDAVEIDGATYKVFEVEADAAAA